MQKRSHCAQLRGVSRQRSLASSVLQTRQGPFRMEHETVVLPAYQRSSAVNVPRVASAIHFPQDGMLFDAQNDSAYNGPGPMSFESVRQSYSASFLDRRLRPAQTTSGASQLPGTSPQRDPLFPVRTSAATSSRDDPALSAAFSCSPAATLSIRRPASSLLLTGTSPQTSPATAPHPATTPFLATQFPMLHPPTPDASSRAPAPTPIFSELWSRPTYSIPETGGSSQDPPSISALQGDGLVSLWPSSGLSQHQHSRQLRTLQSLVQGSSGNADALARGLAGDAPLWPSQGEYVSAPGSHVDSGQGQQLGHLWHQWHSGGGAGTRASVGYSMALSDFVGMSSGPNALYEHQGTTMSMGDATAESCPPQAPTNPPVYCKNCTLEIEPSDLTLTPTNTHTAPQGDNTHPQLICPHCNHPAAGTVGVGERREGAAEAAAARSQLTAAAMEVVPGAAPRHAPASPTSSSDANSDADASRGGLVPLPSLPLPSMASHGVSSQLGSEGVAGAQQLPTVIGYDDRMLAHREPQSRWGPEHPERPSRLVAIMEQLASTGLLDQCQQIHGRAATDSELEAIHDPELPEQVAAASAAVSRAKAMASGMHQDTEGDYHEHLAGDARWVVDCPVNEATADCARIAAGTAIDVALAAVTRRARNGAAIIRPPGHHAESALSMGFCLYNNAAVAARAAQKAGARRVAIIDWDVHHGNGTSHAFYDDPSVLFISSHRWDRGRFFPGTGGPREAGAGPGTGYNVNIGWNGPGITDADCLHAFRHVVMPIASAFRPDLVIVSAGFDAALGDPLGGCDLSPAVYGHLTQMVSTLAPTVLLLEGGYNLAVTAACTAECVRVLLGGAPADLPDATQPPSPAGVDAVLQTLEVHASYWPVARENLDLLQEQQEVMREQEQLLHGPPSVDSVGEADLLGALLDERLVSSLDQPPNQPTA